MTYTTGLTLASEELQFFCVTEFDKDVDCPLLVIFVLADANFTCTSNACGGRMIINDSRVTGQKSEHTVKGSREFLPDTRNKFLKRWLPVVLIKG